jgi:uncharacterized membrane protein HdeD (DUF308 family)
VIFPSEQNNKFSRSHKKIQGILLIILGGLILIKPELILVTLALIVAMILIAVGVFNFFWAN